MLSYADCVVMGGGLTAQEFAATAERQRLLAIHAVERGVQLCGTSHPVSAGKITG